MNGLTVAQWNTLQRNLCRRFGLNSKAWSIESGKVSRNHYWVTLWGPENKRIKARGVREDLS